MLAGSDDLAAVALGALPIPPSALSFIKLRTVARGSHDLAIGLCKLGFLGLLRLGRDSHSYGFVLGMSIAMGAASLASPTAAPTKPPTLLMPLERVARRLNQAGAFALRLQRVDGRRFDALVADIFCSRLHGVAAPTVSYVSAPLVRRASVHLCECVCACARCCRCVWVCLWVCPISCVWVPACVFACRAKSTDSRAEPHGVLEAARASTAYRACLP